ncbi:ATP-dependent DNA helicase Q-like 5 [Primulina tabacum]|uniref:ATP-dependent DNA helicase Q-like 5 n=1 Tax=Primulina tabacum TaxID=48773 RepID=UPI003F59220D
MNQHTACLLTKILEYFTRDADADVLTNQMDQSSPFLRADVKVFLRSNSHAKFTPRAIARIFRGLSSPAFPSTTWSRTHFWGRYAQMDFKVVMEAAKAELMKFAGKDLI